MGEQQLDLLPKPIIDREAVERIAKETAEGGPKKFDYSKVPNLPQGDSRHKPRYPYPQGIDGNPIIEEQKK